METNKVNDDTMNESTNSKESEEDKSFVTKVRSRVSGLLSSSLSRLFKNQHSGTGVIRPRSVEDDEVSETQPPCKKPRGMENDTAPSIHFPEVTISRSEFLNPFNNRTSIEFPTESIPGPSFISTKSVPRTLTSTSTPYETVNRGKYVSSECTSGYSSMTKLSERQNIPVQTGISENKIQPNGNISEKRTLFNVSSPETPTRSLFANMSPNSQDKSISLSSKRPSFNASNLGSPSFVDRTLTTNRIINSPFYNGSTMYGGASAYGQQLAMNETRKQQLKNSFMVKPINRNSETKSFTSLSKTARRILETLEQCSSPMSDVKKVPLPTRTTNKQGLFSKYVAANPYSRNSAMSKELLVPTVSDRLKMKQIQRLQDTTNEIRQIASSSNSNLNQEDYKIATESQQKHTNKMKTKVSSVRTKAPAIEVLDDYILNPVPLMLPENKCPAFKIPELNISMPKEKSEDKIVSANGNSETLKNLEVSEGEVLIPPVRKDINDEEKSVTNIQSNTNKRKVSNDSQSGKNDNTSEYTFSKPLVIADNAKSIIAINNFKFSEPLSKKLKLPEKIPNKQNESRPEKLTNGSISCESEVVNKTNDPLFEKFKPPEGTWECQTCLIRNKSAVTKCAACETPKTDKSQTSIKAPSFGLQFQKKVDEWDCPTCLVRNKLQSSVCVACSTARTPRIETNGISHKLPSNEWECESCWVRNKSEANKCVACESTRVLPSKTQDMKAAEKSKCLKCFSEIGNGEQCSKCSNQVKLDFPSHLKPSPGSWECGTCLIRNKSDLKICAACETPKEKSNDVELQKPIKKSDKWECPTCMVRNDDEVEKCPCCETAKPGVTLINKNNVNIFNFGVNKSQFSFGIPKEMQSNNQSAVSSTSSLFASKPNDASSATPVFKFGIPSSNEEKDKDTSEQKDIKLPDSVKSKTELKPDSSSLQNTEKEKPGNFQVKAPQTVPENNSVPVLKFGASSTDSKDASSNLFKFASPKPLNVETKFSSLSDSLKKPDSKTTFVAPSVSQNDASKPLFSFGSKDNGTQNQTSSTMFSFGSKDNDTKNQKTEPLFSFGSSSSSTQPAGGFSFNSAKADGAQQPSGVSNFVPNPVQQSLSTNQGSTALKNGGFNFGSTTAGTGQAALFNFGASSNPTATAPLGKGGFDFSSAAKPTEGFNFSSPLPSFDAASKPSFNFTGGSIPTFSANPSEGVGGAAQPVRKFKRAVRRTQR